MTIDHKRNSREEEILEKVISWSEDVKAGRSNSRLCWSASEKASLSNILTQKKASPLLQFIQNTKYHIFFKSIIDNGLNADDVHMFYKYRDRLPLRILGWIHEKNDFNFKEGACRSLRSINAGFYMLEIELSSRAKTKNFEKLTFRTISNNKSTYDQFEIPLISNRICKRLIYLQTNTQLEATLEKSIDKQDFLKLRLIKLSKKFFLKRLHAKLNLKIKIDSIKTNDPEYIKRIFSEYNQLFIAADYRKYLLAKEKALVDPLKVHMANLKKWGLL